MKQQPSKNLLSQVASKKAIEQNAVALKLYGRYKKVLDLIDRTDIALGRKPAFVAGTGSTLNFEVNRYGIASTTA